MFFDNKQSYYEVIAGRQTYDYLICVATGKVIEFSSEKLRRLRDEICREHGFAPLSHQFHIFAVSPEGQAKPRGRRRRPAAAPVGADCARPDPPLAEGDERRQGQNGESNLTAPERRGGEVEHGGNHS